MPDEAFRRAPPSPNIEDRRDELSELTHLLMATGAPPPDQLEPDRPRREALGLGAGQFLIDELPIPPDSALGVDGGIAQLDSMRRALELGKALAPPPPQTSKRMFSPTPIKEQP